MDMIDNNVKVLCSFVYGSCIYDTLKPESDIDMYVICDDNYWEYDPHAVIDVKTQEMQSFTDNPEVRYIDKHYISLTHWEHMLQNNDIEALEGVFVDPMYVDNYEWFYSYNKDHLVIDKEKIRRNISKICSNSWVKCKKKLTVEEDTPHNKYIALKSLFHVIRLYAFGIQLGKYGEIVDYKEASDYYNEIMKYLEIEGLGWDRIKMRYKGLVNSLHSNFVIACPMNKSN